MATNWLGVMSELQAIVTRLLNGQGLPTNVDRGLLLIQQAKKLDGTNIFIFKWYRVVINSNAKIRDLSPWDR